MDAIYANKMRPTGRYECGDVGTVASEKVGRGCWGAGNTNRPSRGGGRNAVARTFDSFRPFDEVVAAAGVLSKRHSRKKDGLAARGWGLRERDES